MTNDRPVSLRNVPTTELQRLAKVLPGQFEEAGKALAKWEATNRFWFTVMMTTAAAASVGIYLAFSWAQIATF